MTQDTKIYKKMSLTSGEICLLPKSAKVKCKQELSNDSKINSMASLISDTSRHSRMSRNSAQNCNDSKLDYGIQNKLWIEVYDARSNSVGYILR